MVCKFISDIGLGPTRSNMFIYFTFIAYLHNSCLESAQVFDQLLPILGHELAWPPRHI